MKSTLFRALLLSGCALGSSPAFAQDAAPAAPVAAAPAEAVADTASPTDEIVVTARRREEKLQDVPVAVSAFSSAALKRSSVQTVSDIRTLTPGFTFASEGGKSNTALSLRGIGQIPTGEATPGVVTYVNNVPLPSIGSDIPTFDLASIQVLKGPQGTLFGRNTLGGAVLISPQAPTYRFEGYLEGTYGNYDDRELQGAINIPIVEDKVAFRVAGQLRRRDPLIHSINGGEGFNNTHQDAVRAALLIEPTDWLKNTTTVDYFKATESGSGYYLLRQNFSFTNFFGAAGTGLDQQTAGFLAGQKNDFYGAYTDSSGSGRANRRSEGVTNDTTISLGDFSIRNIFGYRKNRSDQLINTGAVGPLNIGGAPFTLFHAAALIQRQYLTNELQFLGTVGRLNFILGGFYNNDKPDGVSGSTFDAFTFAGAPASVVTAHVENKNKALFGQATYKITDKLSATAGLRYSWDKVNACGGAIGNAYATDAQCRSIAAQNLRPNGDADGVGVVKNSGSAPSWTLGLDWKVNSDLLLYITSRRGYRAANVNTPLFETRFTTGGTDVECGFGTGKCVDLRPYQKTGKEKLTDVEIGEKWDFRLAGARGRINTAAFYSKYKNALQFLNAQSIIPSNAPDNPTNASFGANVADLTIWGVELEASVSPSDTLTISFNGAYNHTTVDRLALPSIQGIPFTKANVSTYSPKVSGTVSANWTLPIEPLDGKVSLNADLFMTDDFGGQNGEKLPGYNLLNMRLDWKNIGGLGLDLSGFVRNLTKEHYFASASVLLQSFPVSSVAVGDPRTYGVTARYSF